MQQTSKARLNAAFAELRRAGYFAKQKYWCCQTCGWSAATKAAKGDPKGPQKIVFYHMQDAMDLKTLGACYLRWEGDGHEIVAILGNHGIRTEWNGSPRTAIQIFADDPPPVRRNRKPAADTQRPQPQVAA